MKRALVVLTVAVAFTTGCNSGSQSTPDADAARQATAACSAAHASVLVTDHGPGIPTSEQDIFERFWHGDESPSRTGLGLAIAKQIALAQGGDITLRSPGPAGDGCAFLLRLRR
jgi:two-component system OmpR family sensor kinase